MACQLMDETSGTVNDQFECHSFLADLQITLPIHRQKSALLLCNSVHSLRTSAFSRSNGSPWVTSIFTFLKSISLALRIVIFAFHNACPESARPPTVAARPACDS